ncbi:serine dehydratase beta chain, partial [Klebsiella aerogenes]
PLPESIVFHDSALARHENGMRISAWDHQQPLLSKTYYSIGGGFIVEEACFGQTHDVATPVPFDFRSAHQLLQLCEHNGLSISGLMMQ